MKLGECRILPWTLQRARLRREDPSATDENRIKRISAYRAIDDSGGRPPQPVTAQQYSLWQAACQVDCCELTGISRGKYTPRKRCLPATVNRQAHGEHPLGPFRRTKFDSAINRFLIIG